MFPDSDLGVHERNEWRSDPLILDFGLPLRWPRRIGPRRCEWVIVQPWLMGQDGQREGGERGERRRPHPDHASGMQPPCPPREVAGDRRCEFEWDDNEDPNTEDQAG